MTRRHPTLATCCVGLLWLAMMTAGCADAPEAPELGVDMAVTADMGSADLGSQEVDMPDDTPALDWEAITSVAVSDEGAAAAVEVSLGAGGRAVVLRARPDGEDAGLCYGFDRVSLSSGRTIVAPAGRYLDGGLLLITDPEVLAEADTATLEISMYDCDLGARISRARAPQMPRALLIDRAVVPAPEAATGRLEVRFLRAGGLPDADGPLTDDPTFSAAWAFATARYAEAGITLTLGGVATREEAVTLARVGPGAWSDALDTDARDALGGDTPAARFVPVAIVPCIAWEDATSGPKALSGFTGRVPGLLAADRPRSVVLWATDCSGEPDAERLGAILAHELGHYLGLYHSDTPDGAHLAGTSTERLMDSAIGSQTPLDDARFSPAQIARLQGHPDVVW